MNSIQQETRRPPDTADQAPRIDAEELEVLCRACRKPCHRSSRHGLRDRLKSWFGWYPWRCQKCQTRQYVRRRY